MVNQRVPHTSLQRRAATPPYPPFGAFRKFLEKISSGVPSRIDKGVLPSTSHIIKLQLTSALRYLDLVAPDRTPTDKLKRLVKAPTSERKGLLREIIVAAYPFLFVEFDLRNATTEQVEQKFREHGRSGDTLRKSVAFFVAACNEASVEVSPYIKPFQGARSNPLKREAMQKSPSPDTHTGEEGSTAPAAESLESMLPPFDRSWSDELKTKWFEAFQSLIERAKVAKGHHQRPRLTGRR